MEGQQHWNNLSGVQQADVLAYDQVRQHDEQEFASKVAGSGFAMPKGKPRKR